MDTENPFLKHGQCPQGQRTGIQIGKEEGPAVLHRAAEGNS